MRQRLIQILLAVAALAAALIGANYWRQNYLAGIAMLQVPVPKSDVPPYTLLTADLFELRAFPRALAGDGLYALSASDLDGRISAGILLASQPVPLRMVPAPQQFRLADPTLEVASLPLETANGVGGQIRPGDKINLYLLQNPAGDETHIQEVTFVARVQVAAVLSDNGQPATYGVQQQPQPMKTVVVAAPPETIRRILSAIAKTKLEGALLWVTLATP